MPDGIDDGFATEALRRCVLFAKADDLTLHACVAQLRVRRFRRGDHIGDPARPLADVVRELAGPGAPRGPGQVRQVRQARRIRQVRRVRRHRPARRPRRPAPRRSSGTRCRPGGRLRPPP